MPTSYKNESKVFIGLGFGEPDSKYMKVLRRGCLGLGELATWWGRGLDVRLSRLGFHLLFPLLPQQGIINCFRD